MKDYETQKLIDQYIKEIEKWQNLSRSLMTMSEIRQGVADRRILI